MVEKKLNSIHKSSYKPKIANDDWIEGNVWIQRSKLEEEIEGYWIYTFLMKNNQHYY